MVVKTGGGWKRTSVQEKRTLCFTGKVCAVPARWLCLGPGMSSFFGRCFYIYFNFGSVLQNSPMRQNFLKSLLVWLFPRFPHDNEDLLKKWIQAWRRKGWHPSKNERISEQHFLPGDYKYPPTLPYSQTLGRRFLKEDAVPSVFNFPKHLVKKSVERRAPLKRPQPSLPEPTEAAASSSNSTKAAKVHETDHTYACNVSPRKLKARYETKLKQKLIT